MNGLFIINSLLLGVGLAMDAFSVSLADGLGEPKMRRFKACAIAGAFAFFQALMPMTGWVCVKTIVGYFTKLQKAVPWIALLLLLYIGGSMLVEGLKGGEDEKAVLLFLIYNPLNVGKQLGNTLHFVKDGSIWKLGKKGRGVSLCVFAGTGMLKRFVGLFREKRLYKRCFSRLPRADNRDHGKILCGFPYRSCHESFDFHGRQYSTPHAFMQYGKSTSRIALEPRGRFGAMCEVDFQNCTTFERNET